MVERIARNEGGGNIWHAVLMVDTIGPVADPALAPGWDRLGAGYCAATMTPSPT